MVDISQDKKDIVVWDHCPRCGFLNCLENTSIAYGNNLSSPVDLGFGTDCWLCGMRLKGHRNAHLCIKMNIKPKREFDDLLDSLQLAYKQLEEQERENIEVVSLGGERKIISGYPRNHSKSKRILDMMSQVHLASDINLDNVLFLTREERRWNDAEPVLIQLQENIREYKELVKKNWLKYHKYFQGKVTINEVLG